MFAKLLNLDPLMNKPVQLLPKNKANYCVGITVLVLMISNMLLHRQYGN